jgi:hypothetical protein
MISIANLRRKLNKHIRFYGDDAMHYAVEIKTKNGWIVARPTTGKGHWPWYVYESPDATPTCAYWGFGPGFEDRDEYRRAHKRFERGLKVWL